MRKRFSILVFYFSILVFYFLISESVFADYLNQAVIFNIDTQYEYLGRNQISGTLRRISDKAYWYISDDYWAGISEPERDLFLQRLDVLAQEFDARIYPIETQFWGSEPNPGVDNDPRLTVFITRLVDFAGGYFDSSHLYKKSQVSDSNEREMVFLNSISLINGRAKIFLAHEFQHLIGLEQKDILRNVTEDIWLNEARAEYAPRLLDYDQNYESSNIRRRVFAFQSDSSDPLAEWKNESSDYGIITLFSYYLADHYGDKILADSLRNSRIGIGSLNEALLLNGFTDKFSDIFSNWTIANILNDASINSKFAYKYEHLKNFRIQPSQSSSIYGLNAVSISKTVKDWQPVWYEFSAPVNSPSDQNLRIDFSADSGAKFSVPYVAFKINGQKEAGFIPVGTTFYFKNFGSDVYKIILIPANHSKTGDFSENDPSSSFKFEMRLTEEFKKFTPTPLSQVSPVISVQNVLDQITALQEELNRLQKSTSGYFPLIRDLYVGSQGEDVRRLQDFLIKNGVYSEARVTGYFGLLTKNAVIRFQRKYGIYPQIGYVGLKTRAKIQELLNF
jgi:hypothetical protein